MADAAARAADACAVIDRGAMVCTGTSTLS